MEAAKGQQMSTSSLESWQEAGTSLLLMARFFPKLRKARRAAAARKCVPNLVNLKDPLMVPVGVEVSPDALSRASCDTNVEDCGSSADTIRADSQARLAVVAEESATENADSGSAEGSTVAPTSNDLKYDRPPLLRVVSNPSLNSRLFLTAGFPKNLDVLGVLDVQVTVGHEGGGSGYRPLPFAKQLKASNPTAFCATEVVADRKVSAGVLRQSLWAAYSRALSTLAKEVASTTAAAGKDTSVIDAKSATAGIPQAQHDGNATNVVVVVDDAEDDAAFSSMIPEARQDSPRTSSSVPTISRQGASSEFANAPNPNPNPNLLQQCIVAPFPLGFSQPTAVAVEEYAAHFSATLRTLMNEAAAEQRCDHVGAPGGVEGRAALLDLLRRHCIVVVAFDAQQQELLETCFQTFFPVTAPQTASSQ